MYNKLFQCRVAKVLDVLAANPEEKYTPKEIAIRTNLHQHTTEDSLRRLELFGFIEKKDDGYSLRKTKMVSLYLVADFLCREENSEVLQKLWDNGDINAEHTRLEDLSEGD